MVLVLQVFRKNMDAFLTETALKRLLRGKKDYPPTLEQIVGKYIILEIINIIKVVSQKSYSLCYCNKLFGCAPHFYSDNYYMCEVCQLCTYFCPYVLVRKLSKDTRNIRKIATNIFKRRKLYLKTLMCVIRTFLILPIDIHFLWAA